MAANYPLSNFKGIDIVPSFPVDTHPSNTTFEAVDITEGLPYPGNRFDFINVRFLFSLIPEKYIKFIFNEFKRVLKPGGWLEVMDYNSDLINPGPAQRIFYNKYQALYRQRGINFFFISELPRYLPNHDFIEIHNEGKTTFLGKRGGIIGESCVENWASVYLTLKNSLAEFSCMSTEDYNQLVEDFKKESSEYHTAFRMSRTFAQKPRNKIL
ncbi:6183_t:CDS:2 [Funneliformis geosporum]|uniref:11846_t:CDS:1 n=1 Tax=Funneliformis geosporum TaxID=1117311 RepID=A0A9W4SF83_9GLOM|nr:6183_t:CDS:2 [Funneliformis geosporum]CAI2167366.1 11846_t:CDS:2 [Funneliformis geosporum]